MNDDPDLERRFGGLRRLYGQADYARLRAGRVAVVGLGGVGSWVVEALARSGVATLVLFDLDHVAESNIHRQVQALGRTLGQAKAQALRERIADIHPGCRVIAVEDFVQPDNWPALLPEPVDVLVDACDQVRAKLALAQWATAAGVPLVCVGAAGGKRQAARVEVADLAAVTHDPLLASLRQRLRQQARRAAAAAADAPEDTLATPRRTGVSPARLGLRCVFSRESVALPVAEVAACESSGDVGGRGDPAEDVDPQLAVDGSLNCAGYGSSVTVTASFGMVAAGEAISLLLERAGGAGN